MAKLYFRYGAMNSGKSTVLMQVAHNYDENDKKVILIKSATDTKADNKVSSRIGLERKVDYLIKKEDHILDIIDTVNIDCILVDEAQFLTKDQITELFVITKIKEIPVICYGLKTDYRSELFEGSKRLLELADEIEELKTICSCGKAARFNARYGKETNEFVSEGEQIVIDGDDRYGYKPLCGKCYLEKVGLSIYDEEVKGNFGRVLIKNKAKNV